MLRTKGRGVFIGKQKRNLIIFQSVFHKVCRLSTKNCQAEIKLAQVSWLCFVGFFHVCGVFSKSLLVIPDSWVFKVYCLYSNGDHIHEVIKKSPAMPQSSLACTWSLVKKSQNNKLTQQGSTSLYYIQIAINTKLWDRQISARGSVEQIATTLTNGIVDWIIIFLPLPKLKKPIGTKKIPAF